MPRSPSKTSNRAKAERFGVWGEVVAALYLMSKLYRIRERRFKTPMGEIDLIASRFGSLSFIEVKTRKSANDEAMALQAVNQRRIVRAAKAYIAKNPHHADRSMQFDVIFLAPWRLPRHVRNAFFERE